MDRSIAVPPLLARDTLLSQPGTAISPAQSCETASLQLLLPPEPHAAPVVHDLAVPSNSEAKSKVVCRAITDADLNAVTGLLTIGFPSRTRHYWLQGFERLRTRTIPEDWVRYGYMLESEGNVVGVLLALCSRDPADPDAGIRCNMSSLFVAPAYRRHLVGLVLRSLRRRDLTYTSLSSAVHTVACVKAIGFVPYTRGQLFTVPSLNRGSSRVRIHAVGGDGRTPAREWPAMTVLTDHAAMGAISLVVETDDGCFPFVFLPYRIKSGRVRLPIVELGYCADPRDYVRFAGPIGRYLLRRHGVPVVVLDSVGPIRSLLGWFRAQHFGKSFRGPHQPRLNDLAYSERAFFGA